MNPSLVDTGMAEVEEMLLENGSSLWVLLKGFEEEEEAGGVGMEDIPRRSPLAEATVAEGGRTMVGAEFTNEPRVLDAFAVLSDSTRPPVPLSAAVGLEGLE